MERQLQQVQEELQGASTTLRELVAGLSEGTWSKRPASGGWSVAHCVAHLNVTSQEFLPKLDAAIRRGQEHDLRGAGPFRRDFMGWLLCKFVEPPYRQKVVTPAKFDPQEVSPKEESLAVWDRLQSELSKRIEAADGLALNKLKVESPFNEKLKYNLLSALMVIPAHQRRHIWQAQQVLMGM